MIRGLYTAATGMMVQRGRMDALTNNLVNADTTGYKNDEVMTSSFDSVMLKRINDPSVSVVGTNAGPYSFGTHVDELVTDFSDGIYEQTDQDTDLSLTGNGFFVVETPNGERYTRAGNFAVDIDGYLVTSDGNYVLGQSGRIRVGSDTFGVSEDGTVTGENAVSDKLRLVAFQDGTLRKEGNSLYYAYEGAQPQDAAGCKVMQGFLEGSNVSVADSMVDMLTLYRKYEACQKSVTMNDETLGLAANKLGRLGG
jgi:flagellar basal-body rod protein FlgF